MRVILEGGPRDGQEFNVSSIFMSHISLSDDDGSVHNYLEDRTEGKLDEDGLPVKVWRIFTYQGTVNGHPED